MEGPCSGSQGLGPELVRECRDPYHHCFSGPTPADGASTLLMRPLPHGSALLPIGPAPVPTSLHPPPSPPLTSSPAHEDLKKQLACILAQRAPWSPTNVPGWG